MRGAIFLTTDRQPFFGDLAYAGSPIEKPCPKMGTEKRCSQGNEDSMPRKPLQVLVIPYRMGSEPEFAVFHRSDEEMWQFIAAGVEDLENAMQAARREAEEEARPYRLICPLFGWIRVPRFPGQHFTGPTTGRKICLLYPSIRSPSM